MDIKNWNNIPGFDRVKETYNSLDLDKWLTDHGVVDEGRRLGEENQPQAEAKGLHAAENRILDWINQRGRICRENVSGHLSDLTRNLVDKENDEELVILEQQVRQITRDGNVSIEHEVINGRNRLAEVEQDVRAANKDFAVFRRNSDLTRLSDYSHRKSAIYIILMCFAIEVVLNATMLMEVNTFGLIGSIGQMGLISAVNVLILGIAMGSLLRQIHHVAMRRKIISWVGAAIILTLVFGFNLAVGHLRDAMKSIVTDPSADIFSVGNDAILRLLTNHIWIDSFESYLLVVLGVLFFCVASWKWLQRDDVYPDFGRRDRELKQLTKRYVGKFDDAQLSLRNTHEGYISKLEDIRHKMVIRQAQWRDTCARGKHIVADYSVNLNQYQYDLNYLLSAYRQANKNARTDQAPSHFEFQVPVDDEILLPPAFDPPDETSLKGIADAVNGAIEELQDAYRTASRKFPSLEVVIHDDT